MKLNNIQQMLILFLWIILVILSWVLYAIDEHSEEAKQKIDEYNFEQLEKAKIILEKIQKDVNKFHTLKSFNEIYNAWIEPIKNCYYISNVNWKYPYIFWFLLESKKYKKQYWNNYYTYPKYDLPYEPRCDGYTCDADFLYELYIWTISKPCINIE